MAKKKTFESTLAQLESIVEELESGSPDLDKMLQLYEEGIKIHMEELIKYIVLAFSVLFEEKYHEV